MGKPGLPKDSHQFNCQYWYWNGGKEVLGQQRLEHRTPDSQINPEKLEEGSSALGDSHLPGIQQSKILSGQVLNVGPQTWSTKSELTIKDNQMHKETIQH